MIAALVILALCVLLMSWSGDRIRKDTDIIERSKEGKQSEYESNEGGMWLALGLMLLLVFLAVSLGLGGALAPGNW